MSNEYSVIFTGNIIDGLDIELVKSNIAVKTKSTAEQVSKLFETAPRIIKKCKTQEEADKLINAFKACGAITEIEGQVEYLSDLDLPDESENENKIEKSTEAIGGTGKWISSAIFVIGVIIYYSVSVNSVTNKTDARNSVSTQSQAQVQAPPQTEINSAQVDSKIVGNWKCIGVDYNGDSYYYDKSFSSSGRYVGYGGEQYTYEVDGDELIVFTEHGKNISRITRLTNNTLHTRYYRLGRDMGSNCEKA